MYREREKETEIEREKEMINNIYIYIYTFSTTTYYRPRVDALRTRIRKIDSNKTLWKKIDNPRPNYIPVTIEHS